MNSQRSNLDRCHPCRRIPSLTDHLCAYPVLLRAVTRKLSVEGDERRGGAQPGAATFDDVEMISEYFSEYYNGESSDLINGRLRLSSYLQPADPRFAEAKGRSVSLSNYILELQRLPDSQTERGNAPGSTSSGTAGAIVPQVYPPF